MCMIKELKKRAIHRTRIIQGQIKGLEKMIENEEYCVDIFTQSLAIQKSLRSLNKLILQNHMKTHIKEHLENSKSGQIDEKVLNELLKIYELAGERS